MTEHAALGTDRLTVAGIALCGVPVAAFSAVSLFTTAREAGVPTWLAWVLPVATDLCALVSTRIWLSARHSDGIRRYAAGIALAAMTLSFVGASLHLVVAGSPWWLRLAVGGVPSLSLAAIVHLGAMIAMEAAGRRRVAAAIPTATVPAATAPQVTPEQAGAGRDVDAIPSPRPAPATNHAAPNAVTPHAVVSISEKASRRAAMWAYLDAHPDASGADLDREFGTNNYGRSVRKAWEKARDAEQSDQRSAASGGQ